MHPIQDLFLESFSYKLQLDMHSYLHKNFILAKSGCYTPPFQLLLEPQHRSSHDHLTSQQMEDHNTLTKTQVKLNITKDGRLVRHL
jgi:hypothetical protein